MLHCPIHAHPYRSRAMTRNVVNVCFSFGLLIIIRNRVICFALIAAHFCGADITCAAFNKKPKVPGDYQCDGGVCTEEMCCEGKWKGENREEGGLSSGTHNSIRRKGILVMCFFSKSIHIVCPPNSLQHAFATRTLTAQRMSCGTRRAKFNAKTENAILTSAAIVSLGSSLCKCTRAETDCDCGAAAWRCVCFVFPPSLLWFL